MKIIKRKLLLLAGIVWLLAGFNILCIGIISYKNNITLLNLILSGIVFAIFWFLIFCKLVRKHSARIKQY